MPCELTLFSNSTDRIGSNVDFSVAKTGSDELVFAISGLDMIRHVVPADTEFLLNIYFIGILVTGCVLAITEFQRLSHTKYAFHWYIWIRIPQSHTLIWCSSSLLARLCCHYIMYIQAGHRPVSTLLRGLRRSIQWMLNTFTWDVPVLLIIFIFQPV